MKRRDIPGPALVLDTEALKRNIETMFAHARRSGVALRPHAKSHKCPEIALMLQEAGALGPSCATLREAEVMASHGLRGILLTSPVATDNALRRLALLVGDGIDITVVADNVANVMALAAMAEQAGHVLPVLVELDVGQGRTGCVSVTDAVSLARTVADQPSLSLGGIQAYWGHLQHIPSYEVRRKSVTVQEIRVKELVQELEAGGLRCGVVTGGGTGTIFTDVQSGVFTELQPGSFLFMDSCYNEVSIGPNPRPFESSLFVAANVVSRTNESRYIVNAGIKAFATDSGKPAPTNGVRGTYGFLGDEHGVVTVDEGHASLSLGAAIEFIPSHCDPTVNLHDVFWLVKGQDVVGTWRIHRGYGDRGMVS